MKLRCVDSKILATLLVAGGFSFTGAIQAQSLVRSVPYPVGDGPYNVVATDVLGNGSLDLVCALDGTGATVGNTLVIYTNAGYGNLLYSSTLTVGNLPTVISADVNNDGKPDLLTANFNDNTISVLTNAGGGLFLPAYTNNVGDGPISLLATNLNGDSVQYLVCANYSDNNVSIFTNAGFGMFLPVTNYPVGNTPVYVIATDVNNDGKLDLVVANQIDNVTDGNVVVLTNNGSGTFSLSGTYPVGINPIDVVAADINGDGKVDLIIANDGNAGNGNTLTILTNDGAGGFALFTNLVVGFNPFVTAADMNGDGKIDLIAANTYDNTVLVLTNNGTGIFSSNILYQVGQEPFDVIAADITGDHKPDLITVNNNSDNMTALLSSVAPGQAPVLTMQKTGATNALLSWPGDWLNFQIEQSTNLSAPAWTALNTPISNSGTNQATITTPPGKEFLRLHHP